MFIAIALGLAWAAPTYQEAQALLTAGALEEALAAGQALVVELDGSDSKALSDAHELVGSARFYLMDYEGALAAYEACLAVSPDSVDGRTGWSVAASRLGRHEEGTEVLERVVAELEAQGEAGEEDLTYALNSLANILDEAGAPIDRVGATYQRSLMLRKKVFGEANPSVALAMSNLASFYAANLRVEEAVALSAKALALQRALQGEAHPDVAEAFSSHAGVLYRAGQIEASVSHMRRAVELKVENHGLVHPVTLDAHERLGFLLREAGRTNELASRALELLESLQRHPPQDSLLHGQVLFSQGLALMHAGRQQQAVDVFAEAQDKLAEALPLDHPLLVQTLVHRAASLRSIGELDAASSLLAPVLVELDALPPSLQEQAQFLSALLEHQQGRLEPALETLQAMLQQTDAGHHESYRRQTLRATLLRELDRAEEAQQAADVLWELAEAQPISPLVAEAYREVALTRLSAGQTDAALEAVWRGLTRLRGYVDREIAGGDVQVLGSSFVASGSLLDLVLVHAPPDAAADAVLRWRSPFTRQQRQRRVERLRQQDERVAGALAEVDRTSRVLAAHRASGTLRGESEDERQRREQAAELALASSKRALAAVLEEHGWSDGARTTPSAAQVCENLAPDEGLVQLVSTMRHKQRTQEPRFEAHTWALVLNPAHCDRAVVVDLGPTAKLDDLVRGWRRLATLSYVDPVRLEEAGEALRDRLWSPLVAPLSGARWVLWGPDGLTAAVNPALLPTETGLLLEERGFVWLIDPASVVPEPKPVGEGALVVGGADFSDTDWSQWGVSAGCAEEFPRLPGTVEEAGDVHRRVRRRFSPALLLEGGDATAARVEEHLPGRRLVHVASHGVRPSPNCRPPWIDAEKWDVTMGEQQPLSLSALVLAADDDRAASFLRADRLASLDLSGAELVVLSACGTGMGFFEANQGVLGLPSAAHAAGARSSIASLWSLDDATTAEIVAETYRRLRLGKRRAAAEALRSAQLAWYADWRRESEGDPGIWAWGALVTYGLGVHPD